MALFGALSGTTFACIACGYFIVIDTQKNTSLINLQLKSILKTARQYNAFPKYNLPQTTMDSLRNSGILLLIPNLYSVHTLGQFSLSNRIFQVPISMLGGAFGQALYQEAATKYNNHESIYPLLKKVCLLLFSIAIIPFIVVAIWGADIFGVIFGKEWQEAGIYVMILSPWMLISLISSTISRIPSIMRKQRTFLFFGIAYTGVVLASFLLEDIFLLCLLQAHF